MPASSGIVPVYRALTIASAALSRDVHGELEYLLVTHTTLSAAAQVHYELLTLPVPSAGGAVPHPRHKAAGGRD